MAHGDLTQHGRCPGCGRCSCCGHIVPTITPKAWPSYPPYTQPNTIRPWPNIGGGSQTSPQTKPFPLTYSLS